MITVFTAKRGLDLSCVGRQPHVLSLGKRLDRRLAFFHSSRNSTLTPDPPDPPKLAFLHSTQDNGTTLVAASQQVYDTLQRTQNQAVEMGDQSLERTQTQTAPSIGPRVA
jgi:hypothetical protein